MTQSNQKAPREKPSYYDPGTIKERLLYGAITIGTYLIPMSLPGMTIHKWAAGYFGLCVVLPVLYFTYGIFRPLFHRKDAHKH